MDREFEYRQRARQNRLEMRRRNAVRRRVRLMTAVFTCVLFVISIVSANAIIANAGNGIEKNYEKMYACIVVERGETVWDLANEYAVPGYTTVENVMEEIRFINSLDDTYAIQAGSVLMVPYYVES